MLIRGLQTQSETPHSLHFKTVLEVRKRLLVHLSNVYPASAMHGAPISNGAATDVVTIITTASMVSRMLPEFRKMVGGEKHKKVISCQVCEQVNGAQTNSLIHFVLSGKRRYYQL